MTSTGMSSSAAKLVHEWRATGRGRPSRPCPGGRCGSGCLSSGARARSRWRPAAGRHSRARCVSFSFISCSVNWLRAELAIHSAHLCALIPIAPPAGVWPSGRVKCGKFPLIGVVPSKTEKGTEPLGRRPFRGLPATKSEKSKAPKSPPRRSGDLKYHRLNNIEVSKTGILKSRFLYDFRFSI